jgi:tetratricopeptide (TPR) repeat protein
MTNDLLSADSMNGQLTRWLTQNYQLVPEGLVFNLASDKTFHDLPELRLQTRGLADGTVRFEQNDVVKLKVLPAYTSMLTNRGRYLALFNQHERAITAFRQALTLNPSLVAAQQGLAASMSKIGNQ